MPRHRRNGDYDFAIHEDQPTPLNEEGTDTRDFADTYKSDEEYLSDFEIKERGHETSLNHNVDSRIPVGATDSNMTKASTLVNGPDDEFRKGVESTIDSMLEELQDDNSIMEEKADAQSAYSRRESSLMEGDNGTQNSGSRRESTIASETHDGETEGSFSRRETGMSTGTYDSERRQSGWTGTDDQSALEHGQSEYDHETEGDASVLDYEDETEASASRRESGQSNTSCDLVRRGSKRTEALIHAAARNIVEQISQSKRNETNALESVAEDQSYVSDSRQSSARPSDVHESAADDHSYLSESRQSSPRQSDIHESETGDQSYISDSRRSSNQSLAAHGSANEDRSYVSESRISSARPSDAHESVAEASFVSEPKQPSARSSSAHESPANETIASPAPSARQSDAHEPVHDESFRGNSPGALDVHESGADEDVTNHSSRGSDAHESLADESVIHHSVRNSDAHESIRRNSIRESVEDENENLVHNDDEAGGSSHNENDDDVFSDHSPRSSVGSVSESEQRKMSPNVTQRRSARISEFSHYDTDDQEDVFVPTVRGTPRPPFRSPSSVKAMQMSSPPPSVLGSPRSSRRTPLPTVSRLGSPNAQYSPKKTPPRFKRNTPPLVLLHATLLPLRWPWGDTLDICQADELSEGGKGVLEAWRQLQDRLGDTVCERGILLPHPQNDFEVLEERLLEALELPLKRRARILECGHYLGPSNEMSLVEDTESEDEYFEDEPRRSRSVFEQKMHWCNTCQSDIRFDSLGIGKVFRVKVYASNGLIKAGAWEACWKEMERVDIELEPIVESDVHEELVRLDNEQQRSIELQQHVDGMVEEEEEYGEEPEASYMENETIDIQRHMPSSPPPPEIRITSSPTPPSANEDRRRRDEERLREIYGHSPPPTHPEPSTESEPQTEYVDHRTPPSPSAEAFARREERRQVPKNDSLPELLLEATKVMMQDRKNIIIAVMSLLVLFLALRGGSAAARDPATWQTVVKDHAAAPPLLTAVEKAPEVANPAQETVETVMSSVEAVVSSVSPSSLETVAAALEDLAQVPIEAEEEPAAEEAEVSPQSIDPCSTPSAGGENYQPPQETETVTSERIVRVVETVTETAVQTSTVIATQFVEATAVADAQLEDVEKESLAGSESSVAADLSDEAAKIETETSPSLEPESVENAVEVDDEAIPSVVTAETSEEAVEGGEIKAVGDEETVLNQGNESDVEEEL